LGPADDPPSTTGSAARDLTATRCKNKSSSNVIISVINRMMVDEFVGWCTHTDGNSKLTDELNNLDRVELSGVLYVLASGGAAKAGAGDTVDAAKALVLDLSSEVGHVIDRLLELIALASSLHDQLLLTN
jgi:hypothetical protein